MQVALLRNGPFQAPPVDGATLPFADVSIQYILDVLYDEVDGHWQERFHLKRFTVGGKTFAKNGHHLKKRLPMLSTPLGMMTSTYFFVW